VIGLGFVLAGLTTSIWGTWSWIPVLLFYWATLIALIVWGSGGEPLQRWLQPSQKDRWIWVWRVLALVVPALFLPTAFLPSLASMIGWWVPVFWFGLGAINSVIEEGYWRGLLLDAGSRWRGWMAIFYSAVCFGMSHLLIFGWQDGDTLQGITYFLGTTIAGVIWGLVYWQTRSLRLPILGHFLQQMLAPPYNVFIQLVTMLR
jgi:membrane protease YdiL (CAAX protease family)